MAEITRRERFTKVASTRVQKIIDMLNLLQNCSNKNNYEYTEEDVNKMFAVINKALKDAKSAYTRELNKSGKKEFNFDD